MRLFVHLSNVFGGASTYAPYKRIGEILEKRGDTHGALEAYNKSLELNLNQPPIIQARARMMDATR